MFLLDFCSLERSKDSGFPSAHFRLEALAMQCEIRHQFSNHVLCKTKKRDIFRFGEHPLGALGRNTSSFLLVPVSLRAKNVTFFDPTLQRKGHSHSFLIKIQKSVTYFDLTGESMCLARRRAKTVTTERRTVRASCLKSFSITPYKYQQIGRTSQLLIVFLIFCWI